MPVALVTGFGPFLDVVDNPSGALARALDGSRIGPWRVVGMELPVSTARAPALSLARACRAPIASRRPSPAPPSRSPWARW
jgi:pyrrolidone-carboxylate peptidase